MKILVTGTTGYLGGRLVPHLLARRVARPERPGRKVFGHHRNPNSGRQL